MRVRSVAALLPREARGRPLDAPIRSDLFGETRFAQHGESLAHAQVSRPSRRPDRTFFPRLKENVTTLRRSMAALERSAALGRHLSPTAQWLLDNAMLIHEQLNAIRIALPRRFYRSLPVVRDDALRGLPRVYGIAWAWVAHSDSAFDSRLLQRFLTAYQEVQPLTIGELWALNTTLRVVLVENLRRLAERVVARNAARDAAHAWVDAGHAQPPPREVLDALAHRGVLPSFLLTLSQRLEHMPGHPSADTPDTPHDAARFEPMAAWLAKALPDPAAALMAQQNETAEDQQSIRNAITTLHELARVDWAGFVEPCSETLRLLQGIAVYAAEDPGTRSDTLHAIERLARRSGRPEREVARALVELTATAPSIDDPRAACAYWWHGDGENTLRERLGLSRRVIARRGSDAWRRIATPLYVLAIVVSVALASMVVMGAVPASTSPWLWWATLLAAAWPLSEACVAILSRLIGESIPPRRLARLELRQGIAPGQRCLVVMPVMLNAIDSVDEHARQLEQHALANPETHAQFALLSDWADAAAQSMPDDDALLERARRAIDALNRRHEASAEDPRFLLLHRTRTWSDSEGAWIGWERKRGKLEALIRALVEDDHHPFVDLGAISRPRRGTRYVVTLDADTDLLPGRLRQLVGIAAHPLNRPRIEAPSGRATDAHRKRVVSGYGIVQPRVEILLPSPDEVTRYHRLFNGQCGLDPYSAAASEVYQDVFAEGSFTGKGLLDVHAMHQVMARRFPDGRLLSHDLIEGSIARCAVASDVTVAEDAPLHADVAASRLHRWTRGDWQLLPFVFTQPMATINRWKMLDNLRRSLVAPSALVLVLLSLAFGALPLPAALAIVALAFVAGPLIGAFAALVPGRDDIAFTRFYAKAVDELLRVGASAAWHVAQLLSMSLLYLDAIARALWRGFVSRRLTLEWTTAAAAQAAASTRLPDLVRTHWAVPVAAVVLAALLGVAAARGAPVAWPAAIVLIGVWSLSAVWTWWVSRPRALERLPSRPVAGSAARVGNNADAAYLWGVARDTWRFYEHHVVAADSHLPPDNVQLVPVTTVAHRTSPTNIGLYLLALACARRLGFIGTAEMAERLDATLGAIERLPKHAGHLPNWIDTLTGNPLHPVYVSAVDSGNLAAHLLVVAQACEMVADDRADDATAARTLDALHRMARRVMHGDETEATTSSSLQSDVMPACAALLGDVAALAPWPPSPSQASTWRATVARARAELDAATGGPDARSADTTAWALRDLLRSLDSHLRDAIDDASEQDAHPAHDTLRRAASRARALALAMDFRPLYNASNGLLHIGLNVDNGQLDRGCYDLLASEARLASLIGIAKGDLPVEHWRALGRPFVAVGRDAVLRSWSGSMFEYLMPTLVLDEPPGSALQESARVAVDEQQREAVAHGTPWGISESAIALQDHTMAYQYGPQGVARLALRRTPADERVIAPYATGLALLVDPTAAVANLRALERVDARRAFGFVESIDYSASRQAEGGTETIVQTHMAHHQSMIFCAAASVLTGGEAPQGWARRAPHLRAVAGLLHECAPREVRPLREAKAPAPGARAGREPMVQAGSPLDEALTPTHWLGNRRFGLVLRGNGAGYSHCLGQGLTRWRDDLLRDDRGSFVYVQRVRAAPGTLSLSKGPRHSATSNPAPDPRARYAYRMQPDRVIHECRWSDLAVRTTTWVSAEDDCELRRVELTSNAVAPLELVVSLAAEPTLAPHAADAAHPAFSNLFIEASWDASENALWLRRRPRLEGDAPWRAVHALASIESSATADMLTADVEPCADRARWLGRYGTAANPVGPGGWAAMPAAAQGDGLPGSRVDTGLDPMAVLSVPLTLAPGAICTLTFVAAAGTSQDALEALVDKYRQPQYAERASNLSHTMAAILLHDTRMDSGTWNALLHLQTLLGSVATRDVPADVAADHKASLAACDRRVLWRRGIGGDRPLLLVTIRGEAGLPMVQTLLRATMAWTVAGQGVDVAIVNGEPAGYQTPVQHELQHWTPAQPATDAGAPRPVIRLLREHELDATERATLALLARVRLHADGRSLAEQVARLVDRHEHDARRRLRTRTRLVEPTRGTGPGDAIDARVPDARLDADDGTCTFVVEPAAHPPRPWSNVLANPHFGRHVTDTGAGHTWAGNSRMHQVTRWQNDPVCDPPGQWLLLADEGALLGGAAATAWPLGRMLRDAAARTVAHGVGFTRITQSIDGIDVSLEWCVDAQAALEQCRVTLRNTGPRTRRLRFAALVEWTLGTDVQSRATIATRAFEDAAGRRALLATQMDAVDGFGGATAWLALHGGDDDPRDVGDLPPTIPSRDEHDPIDEWTCDRREFHDAAGRLVLPDRLMRRSGVGGDPCAALARRIVLERGEEVELVVLLGHVRDATQVPQAMLHARRTNAQQRLERQRAQWRERAAPMQVRTPDAAFDAMVNHWLPYQTVACRLWARAGYFQTGGAFGFRDQLQDAMSMLDLDPSLLAAQLRINAARQFREGDVQHWWHEPSGAGVRTKFSDDRVWLPLALAHYVDRTGDVAIADAQVPFIEGNAVPAGAEDVYETPRASEDTATLYEHAARALDCSLAVGEHGLPLMGTGDWNDGMNRVGHEGRGESVWLAWFLCATLDAMLPLANERSDHARVQRWRDARAAFAHAIDEHAWDGQWYRRATFDDGSWLGSGANAECRIDLIAQCWAVLSGAAPRERAQQAMASAARHLWDDEHRVLRLLTPPLRNARPSAGYIQSYPGGVRENGGQYNHAAVWGVMAAAAIGRADWAWDWWRAISPAHRVQTPALHAAYGGEPFVLAGDVYSEAPWAGRCGWSWYSGSAGWLWRAAVETLCGVRVRRGSVWIDPCLPPSWSSVEVRVQGHRLRIVARRADARRWLDEPGCRGELRARQWLPLASLGAGGFHVVVAGDADDAAAASAARSVLGAK